MKGISTNPEHATVWIESLGICSHLSITMNDIYTTLLKKKCLYMINIRKNVKKTEIRHG